VRYWSTKELWEFAMWQWEQKYYEYFLLTIHGTCWGIKIGQQLKIKWVDLINKTHTPKSKLVIDGVDHGIEISPFCQELNLMIFKELKPNLNELVYTNFRTKKPIDYKNLSKNLQRMADGYKAETKFNAQELYPIKGMSFQIAWAIDVLKYNKFSRQAFADVGAYLGKQNVPDMIEFVKLKPVEQTTEIRFDLVDLKNARIVHEPILISRNAIRIKDFTLAIDE
jgi:hypothetical protein